MNEQELADAFERLIVRSASHLLLRARQTPQEYERGAQELLRDWLSITDQAMRADLLPPALAEEGRAIAVEAMAELAKAGVPLKR